MHVYTHEIFIYVYTVNHDIDISFDHALKMSKKFYILGEVTQIVARKDSTKHNELP